MPARLVRVDAGFACFGFVTDAAGVVVRAAPIARWMVGKDADAMIAYWRNRGADVQWTVSPSGTWRR